MSSTSHKQSKRWSFFLFILFSLSLHFTRYFHLIRPFSLIQRQRSAQFLNRYLAKCFCVDSEQPKAISRNSYNFFFLLIRYSCWYVLIFYQLWLLYVFLSIQTDHKLWSSPVFFFVINISSMSEHLYWKIYTTKPEHSSENDRQYSSGFFCPFRRYLSK